VVDRVREFREELFEACGIGRVEGGGAQRVDFGGRVLEAVAVAAGQHDVGPLAARLSSCFEPDACAAADHDDG